MEDSILQDMEALVKKLYTELFNSEFISYS